MTAERKMNLLLQMKTLAQKEKNMKNAKSKNNIAKRMVRFSNIDYGLLQRDLEGMTDCHSLDELRAKLADEVIITMQREQYEKCKEHVNDSNLEQALFDLFCDKTGWLIRHAHVEIASIGFSGNVSFVGRYTRARAPLSFFSGEITIDELCQQFEDAGQTVFANIYRAQYSTGSEGSA